MVNHIPVNYLEGVAYMRCIKMGCPAYGKLFSARMAEIDLKEVAEP